MQGEVARPSGEGKEMEEKECEMTLRGRSQGQEDGRAVGWKRERGRAAALPSPPMTLASQGAEPDAARTPSPGMRWGHLGACLAESGVQPQGSGLRVLGPGLLAGSGGRRALSAVLKLAARRGGTEGRGRCAGPGRRAGRAGARGAPRTLSPTLRSPCPAQSRSARTAAERMANPGRGASGGLGPGTVGTWARGGWTGGAGWATAGARAGTGVAESVCVRLSVHPPASLHRVPTLQ